MIQEKILVVEDDIQIQNFMVYTLENAGFEAYAVPGGKEAMVMVRIHRSYVRSWHPPEERLRIILQNRSIY